MDRAEHLDAADAAFERETVIQFDDGHVGMSIWTANPKVAKHLQDLGWPLRVSGIRRGKPGSWEANEIPKDRLVFCRMPKKKAEKSTCPVAERSETTPDVTPGLDPAA